MRFLTLMGTGAELLLSLCELGAFFSLKLLCYYFPDFGWFPIIHTLISIQLKTRGTVQMLESFFCATLSSRVLCPVNPGCLGFSRCQGLSLQLRSCCAMGTRLGRSKSLPVLFPFSQGSLLLCCLLISENCFSYILSDFQNSIFRQECKFVPCYSILSRSKNVL